MYQLHLTILGPDTLEVLHEGLWPPSGRGVRHLAEKQLVSKSLDKMLLLELQGCRLGSPEAMFLFKVIITPLFPSSQ